MMLSAKNLFLYLLLVVVSVSGIVYFVRTQKSAEQIACTQEAKQCPDGSYVGRTGPHCEFAKCSEIKSSNQPENIDTSTWKTYRNEQYGIEFSHPNDWTITTHQPNSLKFHGSMVQICGNADSGHSLCEMDIFMTTRDSDSAGGLFTTDLIKEGRTDCTTYQPFPCKPIVVDGKEGITSFLTSYSEGTYVLGALALLEDQSRQLPFIGFFQAFPDSQCSDGKLCLSRQIYDQNILKALQGSNLNGGDQQRLGIFLKIISTVKFF